MVTVLIAPFNFRCVCVCVCEFEEEGRRKRDPGSHRYFLATVRAQPAFAKCNTLTLDKMSNWSHLQCVPHQCESIWVFFFSIRGSCRVNISQEDFLQAFNILACLSLKSKTDEMSQISLSLITRSLNCSFSLNEKVFLICLGVFFPP